jgi:hypothetical protein
MQGVDGGDVFRHDPGNEGLRNGEWFPARVFTIPAVAAVLGHRLAEPVQQVFG